MRLNENPTDADIDHITGQKRARPSSSSLDVQTQDGHMKTTPSKTAEESGADGASYDPEALLQALYKAPELAGMAQQATERIKAGKESAKKTTSPAPEESYPNHLKAMMDDGVPVKQWIVLLLLLGAGAYQLRKAMLGPAPASTSPAGKRGKQATKGKAKGKKGSKANGKSARTATLKEQSSIPIEEELASEHTVVLNTKQANKKKITINGRAKKTTKKAPASPALKAALDSPDSISTDGSSSTDGDSPLMNGSGNGTGSGSGVAPQNETAVAIMETTLVSDISDDAEGWHTVSKDKPSAPPMPEKKEPPAFKPQQPAAHVVYEPAAVSTLVLPNVAEQDQVPEQDQQQPETNIGDTVTVDAFTVVPPVLDLPVQMLKPRKAKKVNKSSIAGEPKVNGAAAAAVVVVSNAPHNVISDEDLALMLQQEEVRFAAQMDKASKDEDDWEGVVVTKRNKKAIKASEEVKTALD